MTNLFDALAETETGRIVLEDLLDRMSATVEHAKQTYFRTCKDGWMVGWTTERVVNGPDDGKYLAIAYKPIGKGARGGRATAQQWERVYRRAFTTRKAAKARAVALWNKHEG
jgi:hypothetical protein